MEIQIQVFPGPKNYKYDTTDSYWWPILDSQKMSKACSFIAWTGGVSTGRESTHFTGMRDNLYLKRTLETHFCLLLPSIFIPAFCWIPIRIQANYPALKKTSISLKHNISAFGDPNSVPDSFGSSESGSVLEMRVQVQVQGNWQKLTNKPVFQPFKMPIVPT